MMACTPSGGPGEGVEGSATTFTSPRPWTLDFGQLNISPMPPVDTDRLKIVTYPHPALRLKAKPVKSITDDVRRVAQRMLELMHEAPGVGLAAPQVGLSWRLFVACPTSDPADDLIFINPILRLPSRETDDYEE